MEKVLLERSMQSKNESAAHCWDFRSVTMKTEVEKMILQWLKSYICQTFWNFILLTQYDIW